MAKCNRFCTAGLLILLLCLMAVPACKPVETKIPVNIQSASEVGSLHFEIVYNSTDCRALRVDKGDSFADILLEYDISSPGHVVVGIVSGGGINGDGTIATVVLETKKSGTNLAVNIENVLAYDQAVTVELPVNVSIEESNSESPTTAIIEFLPTTE